MAERGAQSEPLSGNPLVTGNKTEKYSGSIRPRGIKTPYGTGFRKVLRFRRGPRLHSEQGNWIGLSGNIGSLMP